MFERVLGVMEESIVNAGKCINTFFLNIRNVSAIVAFCNISIFKCVNIQKLLS